MTSAMNLIAGPDSDSRPLERTPPVRDALEKPAWRGVLHQWAAVFAAGAGIVLAASAPTVRAAVAAGVYAASVVVLFGVSATYHRPRWNPSARAWMRRADHAAIFVLIAGTYTAVCELALPPEIGRRLLLLVWAGAGAGVLQSLLWVRAPKPLIAALYVGLGWTAMIYAARVWEALSAGQLWLLALGGIVYSAGAVVYALKRPNPVPLVFGYHEVFHALTLVACALHFALVLWLVRSTG